MAFDFQTLWLFLGFLWLLFLSYFTWRIASHFHTIFKNVKEQSLASVLQKIVHDIEQEKKYLTAQDERIKKLEKDTQFHIQKVGLLRFNPFQDTGGDQSFILALLDGKKTGIVISGLYARSGMRWYIKHVVEGKGQEHELSEEEKKAVEIAK